MKRVIALICFTIGMMLVWPPGEYAKAATHSDQVCMVADIGHADMIAIDQVTSQYVTFEFEAIKPPGVCVAENVIWKLPDFEKFYSLNYRTCLHMKEVCNQKKFLAKNKVSPGQIRIRDDTLI